MKNINIYRFGTIFRRFGTFGATKVPKRYGVSEKKMSEVENCCIYVIYVYFSPVLP